MANTRAQGREDKRSRILDAAVQAFSQNGYHATRMSDIAKAANVADGTVYLYFAGKEELLSTIFEDRMSRFLQVGRQELEKVDGALDKLRRVVELHLEDLGQNPELTTVFQIELRHSSRFMQLYSRGHLRDYFQLIAEILEEGQREGAIRAGLDTWFATKCIFGILDEAATNWVLSRKNYRLHSVVPQILDFVMKGLAS
jgi:TetR/AcrR family fatty acid metabolism transcriptional regulator